MSAKRNRNKKAWGRRRKTRRKGSPRPAGDEPTGPTPSELDQVGVVIVEEQLGLATTDLGGLRRTAAALPFEPCVSLLSMLAGRVEATIRQPRKQLALAEEFFGPSELVERYRSIVSDDPRAYVFGPQSLYTLMRVLVEEAYDAPITHDLTEAERLGLLTAVVASNSVIERGIDTSVGPSALDLLAYELQVGTYYSRPPWMEEMTRHYELYRLATEDPDLASSPDFEPVKAWLGRPGLSAIAQWQLGFALSSMANAWDPANHPHVPETRVAELLRRLGVADERSKALGLLSATRTELQSAFNALQAHGERYMWELRPFNTWPFLRLQDHGGLLLLGRPWIQSWLGEGVHYRAMRAAQTADAEKADGRTNHVQRYTAFAGQVFEHYCLRLARDAIPAPAQVLGEQAYGKGGGQKTSDVAVVIGADLVLFEVNARRVGAEPLLTGDPLDATNELTKLLVKKINQLGVAVGALLAGNAELPAVSIAEIARIIPVVVAAGRLWQTKTLWDYLDTARDPQKTQPLGDPRVVPLQALDGSEYEKLLALAAHGSNIADLLARKASGPYRHRDLAVWLKEDPEAPDAEVRLAPVEDRFHAMTTGLEEVFSR